MESGNVGKHGAGADRTVHSLGRVGPGDPVEGPCGVARARKVQSGKQLVEQHRLFTSQVALDEIAGGEAAMAKQRFALMDGIPVVRATDEWKH